MDHRAIDAGLGHLGEQLVDREGGHLAMVAARRAAGPDMHLRVDDPHVQAPGSFMAEKRLSMCSISRKPASGPKAL